MRLFIGNIIRVTLSLVLLVVCLILTNVTFAYKLIPLSVEMSPTGSAARQSFRIENPSEVPIAIELKIFSRSMSLNGVDILELADEDFIINPAQVIVMPGKKQVIRLQWIGNPKPVKELAFRMITEQMPVSFNTSESDGGKLKLLVRFIASIYVVPRNSRANLIISNISRINNSKGEESIKLRISNTGTAHVLLRKVSLTLKSDDTEVIINQNKLPMLASQNILAGHSREFIIPKPPGILLKNITASINYQGQ